MVLEHVFPDEVDITTKRVSDLTLDVREPYE